MRAAAALDCARLQLDVDAQGATVSPPLPALAPKPSEDAACARERATASPAPSPDRRTGMPRQDGTYTNCYTGNEVQSGNRTATAGTASGNTLPIHSLSTTDAFRTPRSPQWDKELCPDPVSCAKNCALDASPYQVHLPTPPHARAPPAARRTPARQCAWCRPHAAAAEAPAHKSAAPATHPAGNLRHHR